MVGLGLFGVTVAAFAAAELLGAEVGSVGRWRLPRCAWTATLETRDKFVWEVVRGCGARGMSAIGIRLTPTRLPVAAAE